MIARLKRCIIAHRYMLVATVVSAVVVVGAVVTVWAVSTISSQVRRNNTLARQVATGLEQQSQERARNIRTNCEQTNERHDNVINTLDSLIARLPPSRRAEARAGRESTVLLLDAIVPFRDCDALVRRQVRPVLPDRD